MSDVEIQQILESYRKIAVVGLSPVSSRPSHMVTRYMIEHGYQIWGVRPAVLGQVLGRSVVESLRDLPAGIEIVNVFRNREAIPEWVDELADWMSTLSLELRPKVLWLQSGITHPESEERARALGLKVVSDRCIKVDHARLVR